MASEKTDSEGQADGVTNMAGPETQRHDITYKVPMPEAGQPVYYGGEAYEKEHKAGFNEEETAKAHAEATREFDPTIVGEGRVQNWQAGVPARNEQGVHGELDDISTSAIIDDPTLGDATRQDKDARTPLTDFKK